MRMKAQSKLEFKSVSSEEVKCRVDVTQNVKDKFDKIILNSLDISTILTRRIRQEELLSLRRRTERLLEEFYCGTWMQSHL